MVKALRSPDGFIALTGEKPKAVAYHMHDAQLDTSFQIHRVDDLRETSQIVDKDGERLLSLASALSQGFTPSFSACTYPAFLSGFRH